MWVFSLTLGVIRSDDNTWYLSVVMARVQKMVEVREVWYKAFSTGQTSTSKGI